MDKRMEAMIQRAQRYLRDIIHGKSNEVRKVAAITRQRDVTVRQINLMQGPALERSGADSGDSGDCGQDGNT